MDLNKKKLKFIDLFCGIGGFRFAAERNGLECVFSCDIDPFARKTYESNFNESPVEDIYQVDPKNIQSFDILFAGFPRQSFSYSGKGLGFNDSRGTLFYETLRIIQAKEPQAFLLENVKGLVSHDKGKTLRIIEEELKFAGYNISWQILNSADFGLAQKRERWYCVGFREKCKFEFPKPSGRQVRIEDILVHETDKSLAISAKWISRIKRHFNSPKVRVKHVDFDKNSNRGRYGVYSYLKPDNTIRFHMGDYKKTQIQEGFFASKKSISPTVIANRVPQLWDLKRKLSVRECARLQGFPDSFKFPCAAGQSYKQIGNSISVPVVESIIANMLLAIKWKSIPGKTKSL